MDEQEIDLMLNYTSFNTSDNSTDNINSFYFYQVEQFSVLGVLFIVIIIGNGGVLKSLLTAKSRKSRMNFFICHLAVSDLSVGIICVLTDILWKLTVSWNAGNIACKIIRFLQVSVTYASSYVLVALSIDRYDAIRHPMKFSGSWKRAKCLIITAWLLSIFFAIPILILYEEKPIEGQLQCWIDFQEQWHWQLYMVVVAVSVFILPAIIITSCYTIIIATIWSKSAIISVTKRTAKGYLGGDNSRRASSRGLIPRAKVKTVKITLVIVSVFILCWSPYILFDLLQVFDLIPHTQRSVAVATFIQSLAPLNSAANPLIYCVFSTHFCRILASYPPLKWFQGCRKKKAKDEATTSNTQSSSLSEYLTNNTNTNTNKKPAKQYSKNSQSGPNTNSSSNNRIQIVSFYVD